MTGLIIGSIPLLIAFFVSVARYKKLGPQWLRLFTWFFLATFLIQIAGYLYSAITKKSNHFIFNSVTLIETEFYILILFKAITKITLKRIALAISILFLLFYVYQIFFLQHFFVYSSLTRNVGDFLSLSCCFLYLSELLVTDEVINFFRTPMFWIATGIMIALVADFLYIAFFDYILQNNLDQHGNIYEVITTVGTVLEFTFITIGFLCNSIWTKMK